MSDDRMVTVKTAASAFEAQVVAARLGSEGILWQLRGNVDGPYPVGIVEVLVRSEDAEVARELLLADEVEDAFSGAEHREHHGPTSREMWFVAIAIVLSAVFAVARMVGAG
jgi:hypothetical protein